MQRYPFTAATIARPTPVLPAVASMIVPPARSNPFCSASAIMASATRSLTLPPGLVISTFTATWAWSPWARRFKSTSGVWPTASRIVSSMERLRSV
jgi:hypothetical protein